MGVVDRAVARLLPAVPRPVVQRLSSPYIAGATLDDARRTVASLNAEGKLATVDVLGEEITRPDEAEAIAEHYRDVLAAIDGDRLDANVSVKLTGLGLKLDLDLCRELLAELVADAARRGSFVRIDMEDSSCTDDTLDLYRALRSPATTTWGSCSSPASSGRSPTSPSCATCGRACASARASTSSLRHSPFRTTT